MFLTNDILKARGACKDGQEFFKRFYPNGAELSDVIKNPLTPREMLHWGYLHLDASEDEVALYEKTLNINNCSRYFESENIKDSSCITYSSDITNSTEIMKSKRVSNSKDISWSEDVENSSGVYNSAFIFDSKSIGLSKTVTHSTMVYNSQYVEDSNSVNESNTVIGSSCIYKGQWITNSHFLTRCKNITNSIFCSDVEDGSYMMFNKPIPEIMFDSIIKQYNRIFLPHLPLILAKDNEDRLTEIYSPEVAYKKIPKQAWEWVKTLPNYDNKVLYDITMLPLFI